MLDTPKPADPLDADPGKAPLTEPAPPMPVRPDTPQRGCLFALSQPPLMIFLGVIGTLLLLAALHDLLLL
ncbi:hypothetical protein ACIRF8_29455 [Streptomyces sp. NPDC102406]|uniref:hypothetical protein n=1 Tax=Streptomyces sp. NPDC102406 TaxID=3366171 RepID=UPI0037F30F76